MPKGPQEARLDRAVSGASPAAIQAAEHEWRSGAMALDNVAMALDMAGPQVIANFGGTHTGPAAQKAFQQVAEKVRARRAQMEQAADALANALIAVGEARKVQTSLGALPSEPSRPDIAPGTNDVDAIRQQRVYATQLGGYQSAMADREARSEAAANEMDRVYRDSTATMKQVHGEPDTRTGGGSSASGGGGGGAGSTTSGGSSSGAMVAGSGTSGSTAGPHGSHPAATGQTGSPDVVAPPGGAQPSVITAAGTAQDGTNLPPVSSPPATVGSTGGATGAAPATGSTAPGVAGGLAGALGGGLLGGAAGIGGAVRGGTTAPVQTTSAAGRSIGSSARSATTGALGRGGATAAPGSTSSRTGSTSSAARTGTTSATGRPGAATGSAGRAGGRGVAGSTGTAGGRGRAGAAGKTGTRLGPRGAGVAAGRGGRNHDEDRDDRDDLFESPQDWVDDEDVAPGVID
jgi:hypothetical protein